MKKFKFTSFLSTFLAFVMVLSLMVPLSASANELGAALPFKPDNQNESILLQKAAIAEQLNLLEGDARLHEDLINVSGNESIAVIIHLSERPVALNKGINRLAGKGYSVSEEAKTKAKVKSQQEAVQKEMRSKNINFKQGFTFDTVLNGLAATIKADDVQKLMTVSGVTLVEPDTILHASNLSEPIKADDYEASMATSISFLGIEKLWDEGLEGQGIKVAVLDTGIDADHPDFAGIYKGGKNFVPHTGSDYTRPRADDDASETSPADWPSHLPEFNANGSSFYTSHGTHVAGTIAAIGANEYGIKGIAPKVDLYAYRVLGAYGSGSTSGIVKAIDTAVIEGMDIINLSLGGGSNTETDAGSYAINNAMLAGTIGVIATGNSGPNRGTIGTPATARLGIAVGNSTNPEAQYNAQVNVNVGDFSLSKQVNLMGTTFGQDVETQLAGEFDIVAVPGNGEAADYNGLDVSGKVALITRGEIAFVDKIEYARQNGAIATIIHNFAGGTNAPGISDVFLGDAFEFIPSFDMSQTDGDAIRAALSNGEGKVTFGNVNKTMTLGDEVNSSSSRGPSSPNFDIKPDVIAPGTNIMSTIPMYKADFPEAVYDEAYTRKTGTSMATPHITGIVALIKQANPNWDAFDIKVALSNTAKLLNTEQYDVFAQGAGRVQPYEAARTNLLAYGVDEAILDESGELVENLKGTVTFGHQLLDDDISVTKQIRVKGNSGSYNISVEVTKGFGDATVTINKPTFALAGEELLNVTLTASENANAKTGDEILGYIHIKGGGTEISLPFAADFGGVAPAEVKDMEITETDLSFDGDGVQDEAMFYFTLTGDVGINYLEIWDIMNPDGGAYGDGYIGYLHAGNSLGAGSYQLAIRGQYTPWSGAPATTIPDGLYTIDYTAQAAHGVIGDYVGPVVVKTTKPEIAGSITDLAVTGKVTDKYIEYNQELTKYGLQFNLNEKLKASYVITKDGNAGAAVPFQLAQNGSYTFELPALNKKTDTVTVFINDAAGNKAEEVIFVPEEVTETIDYAVNKENLSLQVGNSEQLTVTKTITQVDGTTEVIDVTTEATYQTTDDQVALVENGNVMAIGAGNTIITVTYEDFTATVAVEVTAVPEKPKYIVSEAEVAEQLKNKKAKEVSIVVPENDDEMAVEFSAEVLEMIKKSKLDLVVIQGEATFFFSRKAVEKLMQDAGGAVTITLNKTSADSTAVAVSENFILGLWGGTGDNLFSLVNFNEKIEITLPIDASKVKKTNKVAVLDLNSNKKLKAKYNKGILEFTANGAGSFVVIND